LANIFFCHRNLWHKKNSIGFEVFEKMQSKIKYICMSDKSFMTFWHGMSVYNQNYFHLTFIWFVLFQCEIIYTCKMCNLT